MSLLGKSILELKNLIEKKSLSKKELWHYFINRIKKYNLKLNAFITVVEENKAGLPVAVKDIYCTKGIRTTAGSKVLDDFIPPYESTVTKKLLMNGFSILGKTNLDAWCHGSSSETSDYGPPKNPWDLSRTPGGSSGGSAAAVSSYLAPAALGTETAGSIRGPASWTGLVGIKPTYGRVSRYGVIAMGSSLDCPGPLTLTVEDAAYVLGLIAGKDSFDATSAKEPVPDYLKLLKERKKLKIGLPEEYFDGVDDQVKEKVISAIKILERLGHKIKKIKLLHPKYAISVYTIIQRAEVSSNLSRYDGIRYGNSRDYFGAEAKRRIMLGTYTLSYGYYDAYYKKAQKVRTLIIEDFKRVFKEVNVIAAPTMPVTALKLGESEKYPFFGELMDMLSEPSAVAGLTAISFPVGLDKNNLPIGMQIIGNYFEEDTILNLAYQFEKETDFFGVIKQGVKNYPD
ncbi:MAG: amidase family protein [Microgenomates group bacterium]